MKVNGLSISAEKRGRSFSTSCCCRVIVAVEIITRVFRWMAAAMAGTLAARLLPTPVPAWMTAIERVGASDSPSVPDEKVFATCRAMSRCPGRDLNAGSPPRTVS